MNTRQLCLCLSSLLLSTATYAQPIQFSNGDTLEVELIHQTGTTITFSHPALGEKTIDKAKISNLQELNLEKLTILTEVELKKLLKVKIAQAEVLIAKDGLVAAEEKLIAAKETVDRAKEENRKGAEEKLILAGEKFTAAKAEVKVAEDKLIVVKDVIVAEAELLVAKGKVKVAEAEVNVTKLEFEVAEAEENIAEEQETLVAEEKLILAGESFMAAKEEVKVAEDELKVIKNVIVTEAGSLVAKDQVEAVAAEVKDTWLELDSTEAEENIAVEQGIIVTEVKPEVAEENVKVATQQVEVAEDNLTLAKGEKVDVGFLGTGWFKSWDSSIEIGLRGSSGQSVNANFRAAFNTRYEDAKHRWDFKSFYLFSSDDNISSENRVNALLVKDWFFAETKWFAFASAMYDWDEFKDWKHRLQLSVGPGYQFIKTDEWEFSGRVGGTGIFEFDRTVEDSSNPTGYSEINTVGFEAMIGADLTWHITAKQHFTLSNYFYPSLSDAGEFRNLTILGWIHDIDWFEGLAIKFGIRNEYDTAESIPNDFNYNFSVLWGF